MQNLMIYRKEVISDFDARNIPTDCDHELWGANQRSHRFRGIHVRRSPEFLKWSTTREPALITGQQELPSVAFCLAQGDQKEPILLSSMLAVLIVESVRDNATFSPPRPEARCDSVPSRGQRNSSLVGNLTH
jgi:hypothetical protein